MKKIIAGMMLCLILIVSGCKAEDGSSDSSSSASDVSQEVVFAADDVAIVHSADNEDLTKLGVKIFKAVNEAHGKKLNNVDDTTSPKATEILIGNTNRPESAEALKLLDSKGTGRYGEFIICTLNGKIVINAVNEEVIETAVDYFIENYCAKGSVATDLCYVLIKSEGFSDITLCGASIGKYRIVVPKYNISYLVTEEVEKIRKYIFEETGYMLEVADDDTTATDREIVIGTCAREQANDGLGRKLYEIKQVGNSFYINGGRNFSTVYALQIAFDNLKTNGTICTDVINGSFDENASLENGYSLVWNDEFNSLDRDTWKVRSGPGAASYGGWYGMTTYRSDKPENLSTRDGKLYMTATYDDKYFYGAYIDTSKSLNFTYGYMEISARLADGYGIWHDFWTWSDNPDHLEFDIAECWSGACYYVNYLHEFRVDEFENHSDVSVNYSYVTKDKYYTKDQKSDFQNEYNYSDADSMNLEYHTFGCEWTEQEVIFTRDGEVTMVYNYAGTPNEELYRQPHYFILSMLVGSNYDNVKPEDIADKKTGILAPILGADYWNDERASFIVEYVQLFQKEGQFNDLR